MSFYMTGGLAKREFNEIITAAELKPTTVRLERAVTGKNWSALWFAAHNYERFLDGRSKVEPGVCAGMRNTSEASGLRITITQHPRPANDVIAKGLSPAGVYVYVAEIRSLNSTWGVSGFLLC